MDVVEERIARIRADLAFERDLIADPRTSPTATVGRAIPAQPDHAAFSPYSPSPTRSILPDLVRAARPVESDEADMPAPSSACLSVLRFAEPPFMAFRMASLTFDEFCAGA